MTGQFIYEEIKGDLRLMTAAMLPKPEVEERSGMPIAGYGQDGWFTAGSPGALSDPQIDLTHLVVTCVAQYRARMMTR